ncbi:MAG: OmpA family protein [Treponema sp.]|jgi:outer membrane protein OmpA-like peptidoglycan-associated protein|nr:OmpA family protein [Treponema sp.]
MKNKHAFKRAFRRGMPGIAALALAALAASGCAGLSNWLTGNPKPKLTYTPEFFSPDGDGENDELTITLKVEDGFADSWALDIYAPEPQGQGQGRGQRERQVFKHFESKPGDESLGLSREVTIVWDGKGDPREVRRRGGAAQTVTPTVQSATSYPYVFSAKANKQNEDGTKTAMDIPPATGEINVDILVGKTDDGRLKIQVGSIVFPSGKADFSGLDRQTAQRNQFIIRRIAAALNRFQDYKVTIEGHANPEYAPGTPERAKEDADESKPGSISERRAQTILNALAQDGVAADRMTAVGIGVTRPVVDFDDKDNATQNRRVEFYLDK